MSCKFMLLIPGALNLALPQKYVQNVQLVKALCSMNRNECVSVQVLYSEGTVYFIYSTVFFSVSVL